MKIYHVYLGQINYEGDLIKETSKEYIIKTIYGEMKFSKIKYHNIIWCNSKIFSTSKCFNNKYDAEEYAREQCDDYIQWCMKNIELMKKRKNEIGDSNNAII